MKITKPVLAALTAFAESVESGRRYEYRHEALLRRMTDAKLLVRRDAYVYELSGPFHAGGGRFAGWIITDFGREILAHGGLVGSDTTELTRLGFDRDAARTAALADAQAQLATAGGLEPSQAATVASDALELLDEPITVVGTLGDGQPVSVTLSRQDAERYGLVADSTTFSISAAEPELLELDERPAADPELSALTQRKVAADRDRIAKRRAEQNAIGVRNTRVETWHDPRSEWLPSTERYTEADAIALVDAANGERQRAVDAFSGVIVRRSAPGSAAVPPASTL